MYPVDGPPFPLPESYTQITPIATCLPSAASFYIGKSNIEDLLSSTVPCSEVSTQSPSSMSPYSTSLPRNSSTPTHNNRMTCLLIHSTRINAVLMRL